MKGKKLNRDLANVLEKTDSLIKNLTRVQMN